MDTLGHILKKYAVDASAGSPVELPIGRFKDLPRLFKELGFTIGAEIGVYEGGYSKYLLNYCPGLKLYGIDAWMIYGDYHDYSPPDIERAYEEAKKLQGKFDYHLIRGWSAETAKRFADESLDFVYIDGNHAYEFVVADLAAWAPKVRKGGIIAGHDYVDYSNHKRWKDMHVIEAVTGWVKSYRISPLFICTNNRDRTWFYVKQ